MYTMPIDTMVYALDLCQQVKGGTWATHPAASLVMIEFPANECSVIASNGRVRCQVNWPCIDTRKKVQNKARYAVDLVHAAKVIKALKLAGRGMDLLVEGVAPREDGTVRIELQCGDAKARLRCALISEVEGWFESFSLEREMIDVSEVAPTIVRVAAANKLSKTDRIEGGIKTAVGIRCTGKEAWVTSNDGKNYQFACLDCDVQKFGGWVLLPCEIASLVREGCVLHVADTTAHVEWVRDDARVEIEAMQLAGTMPLDWEFVKAHVLNAAWSATVDRTELHAALLLAATTTNDYNTVDGYLPHAVITPRYGNEEDDDAGVIDVAAEQAKCGATLCPVIAEMRGSMDGLKLGKEGTDMRPSLDPLLRWLAVQTDMDAIELLAGDKPVLGVAARRSGAVDIALVSIVRA